MSGSISVQLAFQKLAGSSAKWEGASSLSPSIYTPSSPWSSSILSHRPGMLLVISLPQSQSVDRKQFSPSVLLVILVLVTSTSLQAVLSASSTSWSCSPGHLSHSSSPSRPLALPPCCSLSSSRPSKQSSPSTSLQAVLSASSTSWSCSPPGPLSPSSLCSWYSSSPSRPLALPPSGIQHLVLQVTQSQSSLSVDCKQFSPSLRRPAAVVLLVVLVLLVISLPLSSSRPSISSPLPPPVFKQSSRCPAPPGCVVLLVLLVISPPLSSSSPCHQAVQ